MILSVCDINNNALRTIEMIDSAISVIWIERKNDAGEFELYLRATPALLSLFSVERYITRPDTDYVMISENVELTTDTENGDFLTVTGRSAESLLGRRVANRIYNYSSTTAESVIRQLFISNLGTQAGSGRTIALTTIGTSHGYTEPIGRVQLFGENILDVVSQIAKSANLGYRMTLDRSAKNLVFDVYKGTDRTVPQMSSPAVIFSPEYDNLGSTTYNNKRENTYNVAYVAGEGQGGTRTVVIVPSTTASGILRRESFVDASGVTKGSLSDEEYRKALTENGNRSLAEHRDITEFSGEILQHSQYKLGVDYFLGDKVLVQNAFGISATAYVTEITEVEDESGYQIRPTLSEWSV